jgi:hypothetical protein
MELRPSPRRNEELTKISSINPGVLQSLVDDMASPIAFALSAEEFGSKISSHVTGKESESLARFLIGARRLIDSQKTDVSDYFDAVTASFEAPSTEVFASWLQTIPYLKKIVESDFVKVAAKASELYYLHDKHLHEIRVVTDIRPVFSPDASMIISGIIKNVLILEISDRYEDEELLQVAIGVDEMRRLREQIDRAIAKTELLKDGFSLGSQPPRVYKSTD